MKRKLSKLTSQYKKEETVSAMNAKRMRVVRGENIRAIPAGTNIIEAKDLELKTLLGCPYTGVTFNVKQGEVFALRGRNGSGKSALLLTVAGRTRFTKGNLTVLDQPLPHGAHEVQKRVGLALFDGLNDLPDTQLVRMVVAAEFELYDRRLSREDIMRYLNEWKLDDIAEKRIRELTRDQLVHLGIALAWASHPDIIVVDDIESQLTKDQSTNIMNDLRSLARKRNVTIVIGVLERDLAAMADGAYYL